MSVLNMTPETIFDQTIEIIVCLEEILPNSLSLSNQEIYLQLDDKLHYSLSHMRSVFKLATNMTLTKYISKRKQNLSTRFILYPPKQIQKTIDEIKEKQFLKHNYENIKKGRYQVKILKNTRKNIIIQSLEKDYFDFDKTYFSFNDIIFKITSNYDIAEEKTNTVMRTLHQSCVNDSTMPNMLSLNIEWGSMSKAGSCQFPSSIECYDTGFKISTYNDYNDTFLLFDDKNVILNSSVFDIQYP